MTAPTALIDIISQIPPDELTFYMNSGGIHSLLALQPDAIALEPTGVHYSRLLADVCQKKGIPVLWVGHCEAVHYRKQNKLPDKNDLADALALAAYAHMYWDKPEFFLWFDPGSLTFTFGKESLNLS